MSLRSVALNDCRAIMRDGVTGFGWPIKITSPNGGAIYNVIGRSKDISLAVDPETLQSVRLRTASVTIVSEDISEEIKVLLNGPKWIVEVENSEGKMCKFAIDDTIPDAVLGVTVLTLVSSN